MADTMIKLHTKDDETVEVRQCICEKSVLIKGLIEEAGTDEPIPLPEVTKAGLEKVLVYCEYLNDMPEGQEPPKINKPLSSVNMVEIADEWNANYVDLEQDALFALVMDANYLDIKSLLEVSCAKVTSYIKNKDVKEIRQYFKIENDFSPEEEASAHAEAEWVEKNM